MISHQLLILKKQLSRLILGLIQRVMVVIRISVPALTEERRKELVKEVKNWLRC